MKTQRLRRNTIRGIRSAFGVSARYGIEHIQSEPGMKKVRETIDSDEPIGIIISPKDRKETRPIFSAYIWGPAPEPTPEATTKVA